MAVAFNKKDKPAGVAGQNQGPAAVSLLPSDAQQGGLIDDVDVEIKQARFIEWDYNGSIQTPVLAMQVDFLDADGKVHEQMFSAGDLKRLQPSADGKKAIAVGGATGLSANSNTVAFIASLIDAGFPEAKFADQDISVMEGCNVHVLRKAQAARSGLANKNASGRDLTVLLVTKINRMPGEGGKTARPPVGGKTASTAKTAPQDADVDIDTLAGEIMTAMLEKKGGTLLKSGVAAASFAPVSKEPYKAHRAEIMARLTDDEWLGAAGETFGFEFDGKTITTA